jgi:hypothetical protein
MKTLNRSFGRKKIFFFFFPGHISSFFRKAGQAKLLFRLDSLLEQLNPGSCLSCKYIHSAYGYFVFIKALDTANKGRNDPFLLLKGQCDG